MGLSSRTYVSCLVGRDSCGLGIRFLLDETKENLACGGCYDVAKRNKGKLKHSVNGLSNKFKKMSEIYRIFAKDWEHVLDFSDEMLIELYNGESYGTYVSPKNGFAVGKQYLSLHVTMWKEDIAKGLFFKHELYNDPQFPHWWLDSIFK